MTGRRPPTTGPFTEIRVHGVGDHDYLSALGRPRVRQFNSWVETADAPAVPQHRLRIINWSRSNRRNTGFLWYLAFPFTLANVAGRMHTVGPAGVGGPLLRMCVGLVGLVLTVSQLAWLVVLGETVLRHLPPEVSGSAAGRTTAIVAAVGLAGWLLYRWRAVISRQAEGRQQAGSHSEGRRQGGSHTEGRQQGEQSLPDARGVFTHLGLIMGAGLAVAWLRPAQLAYGGWPSVATPISANASSQVPTLERLDAMALWMALSTGVAVLAATLLLVRYWAARPEDRRAPEAAAGVLLVAAVLLLHSVTSLLRMVLDNILVYITGLFGASSADGPTPARNTSHAILLAYDSTAEAGDSRLDLFPFLALIVVAAVALAAAVVLSLTRTLGLRALWGTPVQRARWLHRLTAGAPTLVPRILPAAGLLAAAGIAAAVTLGEGRLGGPWLALAILALHLAGAAVILVLLLGQLAPVRNVLGKIADIAGFWPIRDHPLAGVSYRDAVVEGIRAETRRADVGQVVLVAHSQGSVICAWLLAHTPRSDASSPLLVTAGSPLASLYGAFFPAYFNDDLFRRISSNTAGRGWVNLWRDTDPIGTAVPCADNRQLADPDAVGVLRGHDDYWTAAQLTEEIERLRLSFPDPRGG
ncbi:hypothetical protein IWX64_001893 [Arthrobacter sp. CAN_A212]|uniref:hypothetical protein n=1 Tax=unclassified Arthrobacter TaxID=235627 RepID=UPI0018C99679|nr:hypothetical protein [Arthrobacter sp. CAN_C5]MBP2216812.1 hypothetical protein [Arthrobacter sp. CAN_C5]